MSFVKPEGIMSLIEDLLLMTLAQTVPHLKFTPPPFPRMEYKTAIEKVATCTVYMIASCIHTVDTNNNIYDTISGMIHAKSLSMSLVGKNVQAPVAITAIFKQKNLV